MASIKVQRQLKAEEESPPSPLITLRLCGATREPKLLPAHRPDNFPVDPAGLISCGSQGLAGRLRLFIFSQSASQILLAVSRQAAETWRRLPWEQHRLAPWAQTGT